MSAWPATDCFTQVVSDVPTSTVALVASYDCRDFLRFESIPWLANIDDFLQDLPRLAGYRERDGKEWKDQLIVASRFLVLLDYLSLGFPSRSEQAKILVTVFPNGMAPNPGFCSVAP